MTFFKNAMIGIVLRPGSQTMDKYGQALYYRIGQSVPCRFERSHRMVRNNNGDFVTVDGFLILSANYELFPGDIVRFDYPCNDDFTVFNVKESQTLSGVVAMRQYDLVRVNHIIGELTTSTTTTTTTTSTTTTTDSTTSTTSSETTTEPV